MSEVQDWNADDYRGDHESDEHWTLRREFMIKNKDAYPRLRLLSLSQVFANVEFLGCRYPEETMELVAELSQGLVEEYRAKQKSRLQRTFVKASAAAEAKSKGCPTVSAPALPLIMPGSSLNNDITGFTVQSLIMSLKSQTLQTNYESVSNATAAKSRKRKKKKSKSMNSFEPNPAPPSDTDLASLVLVELLYQAQPDTPAALLRRSSEMSGKTFSFPAPNMDRTTNDYVCFYTLGDFVIEGRGTTQPAAKQETAALALEHLRRICYTIQIKQLATNEIGRDDFLQGKAGSMSYSTEPEDWIKDNEDSVGVKLMRLMGWTGGGLGKSAGGIETALTTDVLVGRKGLGSRNRTSESVTPELVTNFLQKKLQENTWDDVVFSTDFRTEERAIIHQVAGRFHLKTRSYGKEPSRSIVVSRKISMWDLVHEIMESGETPKYRLIPPGDLTSDPETTP